MRQLIHLWRKFESMWESVSLRIPMNTSSMPLFSVLIGGVRKLSFCKKTPHLPSTQLWILRGQKRSKGIATDNSTQIDTPKCGQAPSNAANPPRKPRGPIIRLCGCCGSDMIFLSDPCVQRLDQFVVHVLRKIIGRNVWRSWKPNKKQKNARRGSKHSKSSKEKRGPEKHLHNP